MLFVNFKFQVPFVKLYVRERRRMFLFYVEISFLLVARSPPWGRVLAVRRPALSVRQLLCSVIFVCLWSASDFFHFNCATSSRAGRLVNIIHKAFTRALAVDSR